MLKINYKETRQKLIEIDPDLISLPEQWERRIDLSEAYLRGAYLRGAYLSGANLSGAVLRMPGNRSARSLARGSRFAVGNSVDTF